MVYSAKPGDLSPWMPQPVIMFTYVDRITGDNIVFNVSDIQSDPRVLKLATIQVRVEDDFAQYIMVNHGVEKQRIDRLLWSNTRDGGFKPILYAKMLEGSMLLIDGNHRYVAAYLLRHKTIAAKVILRATWKEHLVHGLPTETTESLKSRRSGYPER